MPQITDMQHALANVQPLGIILASAVAILVGLILWVTGRKLARPACVVTGLVLGGFIGFLIAQGLANQGAYTIPLVIGCGIAGALLAGLLFRIWMGVSGAAILALAVPAAMLVWQGTPPPVVLHHAAAAPVQAPPAGTAGTAPAKGDQFQQAFTAAKQAARNWYDQQAQQVRSWWDALSPGVRRGVYLAAAISAVVGLLVGLIGPYLMASFESALVGAVLILLPVVRLIDVRLPSLSGYLPQSPRATLVWLGLITLVGLLIQWTLFHRRADK